MGVMTVGKNVLIPLQILRLIFDLLQYWDLSNYDYSICEDYHYVIRELGLKLKKNDLRDAYTKLIHAKNENESHSARIEYLRQKRQIACGGNPDS
jgi:hypothetical protein